MEGLHISRRVYEQMVAHCLDAYPYEGCGLLAAPTDRRADVVRCFPARNAAESARVYTIDPKDHLRADRDADDAGLEIVAVFHSHTHTDPYPSPTDVAQAPDASWHYVLVSFASSTPEVRSYRIVEGNIEEEPLVVIA